MKELNGTVQEPQQQKNEIGMSINMQLAPDGNVIVTATVGIISSTIVIPASLYDEFNSKSYLPAKREHVKLLESIRRSRND